MLKVPTVTYIGRSHVRRATDPTMRDWEQNQPVEVTSAWLDYFSPRLDAENFRIEGWTKAEADERTIDHGEDGIPDEGWSKKDISKWLASYNLKPSGYATKTQLLEIVATVMSPDGVAETEEMVADNLEELEEGDE